MNRGDSKIHVWFLKELHRLQAKLPEHSAENVKWARNLAFSFKCRNDDYAQMINDLIEKITPIAIAERLTT